MEKNSLQKKHVKHNINENTSGEPVSETEKDNDVFLIFNTCFTLFDLITIYILLLINDDAAYCGGVRHTIYSHACTP
jgi:hypothetical protein